jgi:tripartite-type tricarboxylate transporter receptor subunit TctC
MFRHVAMVMAAGVLVTAPAHARGGAGGYPTRPVRIVVNVAPGGGVDAAARARNLANLARHIGKRKAGQA